MPAVIVYTRVPKPITELVVAVIALFMRQTLMLTMLDILSDDVQTDRPPMISFAQPM